MYIVGELRSHIKIIIVIRMWFNNYPLLQPMRKSATITEAENQADMFKWLTFFHINHKAKKCNFNVHFQTSSGWGWEKMNTVFIWGGMIESLRGERVHWNSSDREKVNKKVNRKKVNWLKKVSKLRESHRIKRKSTLKEGELSPQRRARYWGHTATHKRIKNKQEKIQGLPKFKAYNLKTKKNCSRINEVLHQMVWEDCTKLNCRPMYTHTPTHTYMFVYVCLYI